MKGEKNVPDLRFPEFNENWKDEKLKDLVKLASGGTPSRAVSRYWDNGSIPWVTTSLIDFNEIISSIEHITQEGLSNSSAKIFPPKTILMAMYGQGKTRGKVAFLNIEASTNQACVALLPSLKLESKYLFQYLTGRYESLRRLSNEGGQKNLSSSLVGSVKIPYPSDVEEQKKIANFLGAVDEKINFLRKKRELLERYKRGLMQKLFSQELRFRKDDGSPFPDWKEKLLGDVLSIGSGRDHKGLGAGKIPVYGTGGYMRSVDKYLYEGESVCIGRKGTINKPMYLNEKFWTVDTLFYTHSFRACVPKFIYYTFQLINWKKYNEASGVPSLSKATIEKIDVLMPSRAEQEQITNLLSEAEKKMKLLQKKSEFIESYKQGLLQRMFV